MRRHTIHSIRLVLLAALLAFFGMSTAFAEQPTQDLRAGDPVHHENLTIFPLYSTAALQDDGMLTFEEAGKRELIIVTELNGNNSSAQVNSVHVSSTAKVPVFLMAGEVILGGKQDRIISQDTVVEPGATKLSVAVFCVEHGRWTGETANFHASGTISHSKLRGKSVFEEDQSAVWAEVAETNKKMQATTSTDTYRQSLKVSEASLKPYWEALLPTLEKDGKAVGIAVAIGDEVVSVDAFATPKLFSRARDKLVKASALEAATAEKPEGEAAKNVKRPDKAAVEAFLTEIAAAEQTRTAKSGNADLEYMESENIQGMKASKRKGGGTVHRYYKKKGKEEPKEEKAVQRRSNHRTRQRLQLNNAPMDLEQFQQQMNAE